jgi:hypothetical protein
MEMPVAVPKVEATQFLVELVRVVAAEAAALE